MLPPPLTRPQPHLGPDQPHLRPDRPHLGPDHPHLGPDQPHLGLASSPISDHSRVRRGLKWPPPQAPRRPRGMMRGASRGRLSLSLGPTQVGSAPLGVPLAYPWLRGTVSLAPLSHLATVSLRHCVAVLLYATAVNKSLCCCQTCVPVAATVDATVPEAWAGDLAGAHCSLLHITVMCKSEVLHCVVLSRSVLYCSALRHRRHGPGDRPGAGPGGG